MPWPCEPTFVQSPGGSHVACLPPPPVHVVIVPLVVQFNAANAGVATPILVGVVVVDNAVTAKAAASIIANVLYIVGLV
jgi:hypothetical protein